MVSIVFYDPSAPAADQLIPLVVDATESEQHRADAQATEHEVEVGASTSDHVRPLPRPLTLRVYISDSPIGVTDALGGSFQPLDLDGVQVSVFTPDELPTRIADGWRILEDAHERSLLATVGTKFKTYENMALVGMSADRAARDGSWLRCELQWKQLRTVATELVDDPIPKRLRNQRNQDDGDAEPVPVPEDKRSALLQLLQLGGRVLGGGA